MADVVITFIDEENSRSHDVIVPDWITADEFVSAMHQAYGISGKAADGQHFMRMENPIALIRGGASLREMGMRDGAVVYSGKRG